MDYSKRITYTKISPPPATAAAVPVNLTEATMAEHRDKVLGRMVDAGLDVLVIYGDREHGTNFGYLAGFEPRFEEAALVVCRDGRASMMLGNESLRMAQYSRIAVETVHTPYFSLPNQPMGNTLPLAALVGQAGVASGMTVGIVGWKMFTSALEDNRQLFDVPHFLVEAVGQAVGPSGQLVSAGALFLDPDHGVRCVMNANEIAHYEFGASLASSRILAMLDKIELGVTEMELADGLGAWGQPVNVQTICATGERFTNAVVAPRPKAVTLGDRFTATLGFRGGLTNRSGYVVQEAGQLPEGARDYLDALVKPYFAAAVAWYESLALGMTGGELYQIVDAVLPKDRYGWKLNPGHLTAGEEWLSSAVSTGSTGTVQSGMLFQMDIIPSVPGYGGCGAEDGVALADEALRADLARDYPELWARFEARRQYMAEVLGIHLRPEVLPLSCMNGYLRPFFLNKTHALKA